MKINKPAINPNFCNSNAIFCERVFITNINKQFKNTKKNITKTLVNIHKSLGHSLLDYYSDFLLNYFSSVYKESFQSIQNTVLKVILKNILKGRWRHEPTYKRFYR